MMGEFLRGLVFLGLGYAAVQCGYAAWGVYRDGRMKKLIGKIKVDI
jgi:hypothetical protein